MLVTAHLMARSCLFCRVYIPFEDVYRYSCVHANADIHAIPVVVHDYSVPLQKGAKNMQRACLTASLIIGLHAFIRGTAQSLEME